MVFEEWKQGWSWFKVSLLLFVLAVSLGIEVGAYATLWAFVPGCDPSNTFTCFTNWVFLVSAPICWGIDLATALSLLFSPDNSLPSLLSFPRCFCDASCIVCVSAFFGSTYLSFSVPGACTVENWVTHFFVFVVAMKQLARSRGAGVLPVLLLSCLLVGVWFLLPQESKKLEPYEAGSVDISLLVLTSVAGGIFATGLRGDSSSLLKSAGIEAVTIQAQ